MVLTIRAGAGCGKAANIPAVFGEVSADLLELAV
jgi:hypothetical protein